MNWGMNAAELREAIEATEQSIEHHRRDVLQELEAGRAVRTRVIRGDACALCNAYHGRADRQIRGGVETDCAACPLYLKGYGCGEDGGAWMSLCSRILMLSGCPDNQLARRLQYAAEASKAMIAQLEEVRDSLQAALAALGGDPT